MWQKIKSLDGGKLATIFGALTSLCVAWSSIDWATFSLKRDWMKLVVSGIPALGGYMSTLNKPTK